MNSNRIQSHSSISLGASAAGADPWRNQADEQEDGEEKGGGGAAMIYSQSSTVSATRPSTVLTKNDYMSATVSAPASLSIPSPPDELEQMEVRCA